jgi:hypothetical protein
MRKLLLVLIATAGTVATTPALSTVMSKESYKAATQRIDATFKSDLQQCRPLKANAKTICKADAKATQQIDTANARADYQGTVKARTAAQIVRADAEYSVAKQKCGDLAGNGKDVCLKEAKAAQVSATADAKADRKVNDARNTAHQTSIEARRDASEDKRDADYKVALERCDAFSGDAKSRCVTDAKARFGKS